MSIDYRDLLRRYMGVVVSFESTDFLHFRPVVDGTAGCGYGPERFTPEEIAELQLVSAEVALNER